MTEINQDDARAIALHGVVERVTAWQETATEGTIEEELDHGLQEAGITLTAEQRAQVAHQIDQGDEVDIDALAATDDEGGPG